MYRLPLYLPVFSKFPVVMCIYIFGLKELVFFALHKPKVGFTQALRSHPVPCRSVCVYRTGHLVVKHNGLKQVPPVCASVIGSVRFVSVFLIKIPQRRAI